MKPISVYVGVRNLEQRLKRSLWLHTDDIESSYELLRKLSGLDSGVQRQTPAHPDTDYKVVYWQKLECTCEQGDAKSQKMRHCSNQSCRPFIVVIQVCLFMKYI